MNSKFAFFSFSILTGASLFAQDPWDSSINWDISGETVFSSSKHFDIRKKPTHEDGSANNPQPSAADLTTALGYLENTFSVYHADMGFEVPDADSEVKHKIRMYLYQNIDALYGGADQYGAGIWAGVGALKDNWGLAHEYSHGLQSLSGGLQRSDYASWFYESHANWMAHQVIPSNPHCSEMLVNYPYLYLGSTRNRYCNWQFFEYLKDNHGGTDAVNDIWRHSLRNYENGVTEETPFTALMRNKGWDVSTLNDTIGFWAMHNVTWDYSNGAVYRNSYGSYDNRQGNKRSRITMLEQVDSANNRYVSPSYWSPQALGYNLVRLYPDQAGEITVNFQGLVQNSAANTNFGSFEKQPSSIPAPNADWRWGLVAVNASGNPRYSTLQKGSESQLTFTSEASDQALYLVVVATPSEYTRIFWDQMYYTIYRYPYMIELEGAKAEGYQTGAWQAPSGTQCQAKTTNWQGCVATTANVDASVFVGPKARILGNATVTGNVRVEDMATVQNANISGSTIIRDQAQVLGGTVSEQAIIENHATLEYGTVNGNAQVGALSIVRGGTVTGNGKFYGVMNQLGQGVTIGGSAQVLGDIEIYVSVYQGVFYGLIDAGIANNAAYGSNRTEAVVEVTENLPPLWKEPVSSSSEISSSVESSSSEITSSSIIESSSSEILSSSSEPSSSSAEPSSSTVESSSSDLPSSSSAEPPVCDDSILLYTNLNSGAWEITNSLVVEVGDNVILGPQISGEASAWHWSWSAGESFNRELTLTSIQANQSDIYHLTVTSGECTYQSQVTITAEATTTLGLKNGFKSPVSQIRGTFTLDQISIPENALGVKVYDMLGNLIFESEIQNQNILKKDQKQRPMGLYLIQFK